MTEIANAGNRLQMLEIDTTAIPKDIIVFTLCSQMSYGMSILSILENIDYIICTNKSSLIICYDHFYG